MRNLSASAMKLLANGEFFAFVFDLKLSNGKTLHLTNYGSDINIDGVKYLASSALNIVKGDINDSGHDLVEVHGIFDEHGIQECDDPAGAQVAIWLFFVRQNLKEALLKLSCARYKRGILKFVLYLTNNIDKLSQNATRIYSKTCRARFGDAKCGVNIEAFGKIVEVGSIEHNTLTVNHQKIDGYFDYGKINFIGSNIYIPILKQLGKQLLLESSIPPEYLQQEKVKIFPGCDKTINSCYTKFNNTLNFRGEPFVPEFSGDRIFKK